MRKTMHSYHTNDDLIKACQKLPPLKTAIVHPVTPIAISALVKSTQEKLIDPILIGPESRIRAAAKEIQADINAYTIISVEHSHAAAEKAVSLATTGQVAALMKGSLGTAELLSAILPKAAGLRTERRVSHIYRMLIPTYHKPLLITDAAVNITPSMDEKADICRNAIDLWRATTDEGQPKVAILAASEKMQSNIQATVDAACLCKMADRGQIIGADLDGPLALDLAISQQAVKNKGLVSTVAGDADILLMPDVHSANMVAKELTFLAGAQAAGIVLGARVPIILTSRADSVKARLTSCALAVHVAYAKRQGRIK